jgi:hypothetical protein
VSIPQLFMGSIEAFGDADFVVVMNSLPPQPKRTDFSSLLFREHLPPLLFLNICFIVALAVIPVTNNLPTRGSEHFCQEVKREAGSCQKMKAGVL